jgi:hypothetical protein
MVKKLVQLSLSVLIGLLVVGMPISVYAVSIINAAFIANIITANAGANTADVAAICPINTEALLNGKYVSSDLKNTAFQAPEGTDIPYMPGIGSNPWVFFVSDLDANEQKCYSFYTGGPAMQTGTGIAYFPDADGMTVSYSDTLLLDNNFQVELQGFVDTSAGDNKNIAFKNLAFKIWVSNEEEISASIYKDGGWTACVVTTTNVPSSVLFIQVTADVQHLRLYLNGVLKDSEELNGTSVPLNENGWSFATNGSMLYLEYLQIWVD